MKIPAQVRNRVYELTCLVDPDLSEEDLKNTSQSIQEVVTKKGGKINEIEQWGIKDLAYTIKKAGKQYQQAHYLHIIFSAEADQATAIKEIMNSTEPVIRYLLVVQED
jgi:small subunit ribosomal protein S6